MVTFYFDTSAIVKRYRKEIGSEVLDKIFERKDAFTISFWSVLEFIVTFSTRMRRGDLSRDAFNVVVSRFLKDVLDRFAITTVNDELVASATLLAVKHALPSADCLQLASAINLKRSLKPMKEELILICSDKELCRAAEKEGIEFIDPEQENALEKLSKFIT
ncbi:type II toxin-antitoxin system VapC family toxin [Candidatus Bathyarchaeota archaeon]|nr:type II toxin-antitoxin system VapC family toxin [Candidatus Bathyarchaeota archaeon]MBS7631822.1 type II toxin-antitoxin system VapC family toxin [Candidatus Bathyarchaeota archaeon]